MREARLLAHAPRALPGVRHQDDAASNPARGLSLNFLYIAGAPGTGKSSLLRELTRDYQWRVRRFPLAHTVYWQEPDGSPLLAELGNRVKEFPGTDTLALNVQPLVLHWISMHPYETLIAEGDRLATTSFLSGVKAAGYRVTLVVLAASEELLSARRAARAGSLARRQQNAAWVKGRVTKIKRLYEEWPGSFKLDASRPLPELAQQVKDRFPPLRS